MMNNGRTFVLVHGAWHGGWCWRRVSDLLQARGHRVFTPTLSGLGDRSHLISASINLDTHIADIVNLFEWENIEDAVLVGHSYGGWPISGAIEKLEKRVHSIVYLDAFLPEDGQRGVDLQTPENREALLAMHARGEFRRPIPKAVSFHVANPADAEWVDAKMTCQPLGAALQPIRLSGARERVAKRAYIRTSLSPSPVFDGFAEALRARGGWRVYDEACGHDMMVDQPQRLAEILLEAA